jgi:hypothetical protein
MDRLLVPSIDMYRRPWWSSLVMLLSTVPMPSETQEMRFEDDYRDKMNESCGLWYPVLVLLKSRVAYVLLQAGKGRMRWSP